MIRPYKFMSQLSGIFRKFDVVKEGPAGFRKLDRLKQDMDRTHKKRSRRTLYGVSAIIGLAVLNFVTPHNAFLLHMTIMACQMGIILLLPPVTTNYIEAYKVAGVYEFVKISWRPYWLRLH